MAVPRNRSSNSRKNNKRSHHAKTKKRPIACTNCSAMILPHNACGSCGYYNNRPVIAKSEESSAE